MTMSAYSISRRSPPAVFNRLLQRRGQYVRSVLRLIVLTSAFGASEAPAQGHAPLIGLGSPEMRNITSPDSDGWWWHIGVPRCNRFGLGRIEDLRPQLSPHFLWLEDPAWRGDILVARARGEEGNGGK